MIGARFGPPLPNYELLMLLLTPLDVVAIRSLLLLLGFPLIRRLSASSHTIVILKSLTIDSVSLHGFLIYLNRPGLSHLVRHFVFVWEDL